MRHWQTKFGNAFYGMWIGSIFDSSFWVHYLATTIVVVLGIWLGCTSVEWSLLVGTISAVWAAELFNSSLERFARGLAPEYNEEVGRGLDISSGAVLVLAFGAVIVGLLILAPKLWILLF